MENASKALIMAGSILLALLIISLLIFGYGQISDWQQTESDSDYNTKLGEYMRKFEQFNRDISNPFYGSELLSLANLQADYNSTLGKGEDVTGYAPIEIKVNITSITYGEYFNISGNVNLETITNKKNQIETALTTYEQNRSEYNNRSVKYYASKSAREIAQDFGIEVAWNEYADDIVRTDSRTQALMEEVDRYTNLDAEYTEFKTGKRFYCTNIQYNDGNGYIETMTFQEL